MTELSQATDRRPVINETPESAARVVGAALGFLIAVPAVLAAGLGAAAAFDATTFGPALVVPLADAAGAADTGIVGLAGLAYVFDLNGFAGGNHLGLVIAWLAGPIGAAIAGSLLGRAAARAVDGSGLWMGATTYLVAIAIAPLAALPAALAASGSLHPTDALTAVPFLWLIACGALAPALAVCLVAGPIWAIATRATLRAINRSLPPSTQSLSLWPVVLGGLLVLLGWFLFSALIDGTAGIGPDGID